MRIGLVLPGLIWLGCLVFGGAFAKELPIADLHSWQLARRYANMLNYLASR